MKRIFLSVFLTWAFIFPAWAAVDINSATPSQLEAVKGIGPSKAKAIAEYRDKHGAFKSLDDLANIKGFGKASIAKLKGELSVNGRLDEKPKAAGKTK